MNTLAKAAIGVGAGLFALLLAASAGVSAIVGGLGTSGISPAGSALILPSRHALADIPKRMLALYQRAAIECPSLPWTVLAAIGKVETDHARHPTMRSSAGAVGPMQFLPSTFNAYAQPVPPGGKKPPTPWDPVDAVYAAARLLCTNGARNGQNLPRAIWHYNHDDTYVKKVLHTAETYAATTTPHQTGAATPPNRKAAAAVLYARAQIGLPYVWGGNGPQAGHKGFDCSGLTKAAYASAGIRLPRVAQDQYYAGPRLPPAAMLLPGDLVFYGTPSNVHHVGIATGNGYMINAPKPGESIREEKIRYPGDDYLGATRPSRLRGVAR